MAPESEEVNQRIRMTLVAVVARRARVALVLVVVARRARVAVVAVVVRRARMALVVVMAQMHQQRPMAVQVSEADELTHGLLAHLGLGCHGLHGLHGLTEIVWLGRQAAHGWY